MEQLAQKGSSFDNPLGLKIGDIIRTSAITHFEYIEPDTPRNKARKKCKKKVATNGEWYICGTRKKAEGAYYPGGGGPPFDYEPPTFTATKYHWVYVCRKYISCQEFLVSPEDITEVKRITTYGTAKRL